MVKILRKISASLNRGQEYLLSVLGISMALLVVAQVFCRYILNSSLFWSEELARYMLVWLSFIGATVAYYRGLHPGVDIVTSRLPLSGQKIAGQLVHLITMAVALVMLIAGSRFAWFIRLQISPALSIPKWIILMIIPLSGGVLFIYALSFLLDQDRGKD